MPDPTDLRYISDAPDYRHLEDRVRYKALYDEVGTLPVNRVVRWRPEWMRHFAPAPRSQILELGAHNGPNLIHYARLGHEVDGVEISDTLVETFEAVAAREAPEVRARMRMFRAWIEAFVRTAPTTTCSSRRCSSTSRTPWPCSPRPAVPWAPIPFST